MCYHMWPYISRPFLYQLLFLPNTFQKEGFILLHSLRTQSILVAKPSGWEFEAESEHRGDGYLRPARLLGLLQSRIPAHGMVLPIVRGIFLP